MNFNKSKLAKHNLDTKIGLPRDSLFACICFGSKSNTKHSEYTLIAQGSQTATYPCVYIQIVDYFAVSRIKLKCATKN
ncbi:hypothetical protein T01_7151 [Trichinella spiralis]|uniref:Uncharacterized protein n=1 Tax=Trichinella spiralis TaxID=6334 RepID=A0A0V1BQ19_TRISP|nr:hypothetical protein T01_7151 [Trichinella spiralis]